MKLLVVLFAVGLVAGDPVHPGTVTSQYHAQDELGQYSYGYAGGPSAKHETRTLDGVTKGGYSYVDGHGLVQSAAYVSDAHNGFRVAATNLPVGPAVPAGPSVVAAAPVLARAGPVVAAAPVVAAGPVVAPAPVVAAPALLAGHGSSIVTTGPGLTATRVITPLSDTVSVNTLTHGHGLGHGLWGGLLRKRRGAVLPLAYAPLGAVHGVGAWHGVASHGLGATLAAPGHDTHAVAAAKAAHAVAHAATAARDAHSGAWGYGLGAGLHGVGAWHGVASHGLGATLAAPGHDTHAVTAAKAAHAVAHAATAARDAHLGAWAYAAPYAHGLVGHANLAHWRKRRGVVGGWPLGVATSHSSVTTTHVATAPAVLSSPAVVSTRVVSTSPALVAAAPAPLLATRVVAAPVVAPVAAPVVAPVAAPVVAPVAAPVVAPVVAPSSSRYHAQDEAGGYKYGYSDGSSARTEVRSHDGTTRGAYSYVDGDGSLRSVHYTADAHNGFRAAESLLPGAGVVGAVGHLGLVH